MPHPFLRSHWTTLLLLLAVAGLSWVAYTVWLTNRLSAAREALLVQDLSQAAEDLETYLRHRPRDAEVRLLAARTARRREDAPGMERHLALHESHGGVSDASALERALDRAQRADLRSVEADLRRLVEGEHPQRVAILEALARGYMNAYRMAQALDALDLLLDLEPNHAGALLLRGRVWESQRNEDEAALDYDRAVALAPVWQEARLRLADVLARLGRMREAVAHYECLRGRPPVSSAVLLGLARCRYQLKESETAERLLKELLAAEPKHQAGVIELGRLLTKTGRAQEAEAALRKVAAEAPQDREAWLALSLCQTAQGKTDDARQSELRVRAVEVDLMRFTMLRDSLMEDPARETERRSEIGVVLFRLGRDTEAVRWLTSALERDPAHVPSHRSLAEYYERTHRSVDAARHRQAAQRGTP